MKKKLKWIGIILGILIVVGFTAFLYLIPPFTLVPPEEFSKAEHDAAVPLTNITDTKTRLIAERGKYIVTSFGCAGCHTSNGDKGPMWEKNLAGGMKFESKAYGTLVSRNITPDTETGIGKKSDEYLLRFLRTGVLDEGRISIPMPWYDFSYLSEEDRYAIVTYLRNIKAVHNKIPDPMPTAMPSLTSAIEVVWGGDYSQH